MSLLRNLFTRAARAIILRAALRVPDFIVGGLERPYLRRWWVIPRNPILNVYVHQFLRDDDDRALHDHPWAWCSILLEGSYVEHTIAQGGIHRRRLREAPSIKFSGAKRAHRIELKKLWFWSPVSNGAHMTPTPCWTLFITGPAYRTWGFHSPHRGWIPWQDWVKEFGE